MAGERILVVDDNPANLRLLRLLLSGESYEVRTAEGAEERAREAGCDGYVSKPIDTRTLPALLARHLSGSEPPRPM
jgi:CheY-like chemotaxis protein